MKNSKPNKTSGKKKTGVLSTVLFCFLLFLLVSLLGIGWLTNRTLNRIEKVERGEESWIAPEDEDFEIDEEETAEDAGEPGGDVIAPEEVIWTTPKPRPSPEQERQPRVTNILLIGQDRRPGELRARSDSMILCSLNQDTNEIVLTSLMRDMYVPFPGDYSDNRINAAYAFGGMSLLDQLIEEDFGIHIDGNLEVDFNGFLQVMDTIGPLEIELKDYEAWHMYKHHGWALREGTNALNAEQLLVYARIRHTGHGDWERTERQRRVLQAAFEKVRDLNLREMTELAEELLPCFTTDLTNPEILRYIYLAVTRHMSIGETYRLPVEGSYSQRSIRGMAVLVPDLEANSAYLQKVIYGKQEKTPG